MTYSRPELDYVINLTGINPVMLGLAQPEFEARLMQLAPGAEAETCGRVTQDRFEATDLEQFEVILLQDAVANRIAARYLKGPASRKASGTNTPVWQVDANQLREERIECLAEARKLEGLFMGGIDRKRVLARPRG